MNLTSIALLSNQPMLAAGLRAVVGAATNLEILFSDSCVAGFISKAAASCRPDVLLVEGLPDLNLDVIRRLQAVAGGAPIVLWVDSVAIEFASQVIGLGVKGILRKALPLEQQLECLRRVAAGELWIEKPLCDLLLCTKRVALSSREQQLLVALAQGLKNKEVAHLLRITEGTVKVYLSRLFQKVFVARNQDNLSSG